jgi:hypothetical protein
MSALARVDRGHSCGITYNFSVQLLDLGRLLVSPSEVEVTHCGRKSGFAGVGRVADRVCSSPLAQESAEEVTALKIKIQQRLQQSAKK